MDLGLPKGHHVTSTTPISMQPLVRLRSLAVYEVAALFYSSLCCVPFARLREKILDSGAKMAEPYALYSTAWKINWMW